MLTLSGQRNLLGWNEAFVRTCYAMAREGARVRTIEPRGKISIDSKIRCPTCNSDSFFIGEDLECGKTYEVARARFCAVCDHLEVLTEDANYEPYNQRRFLPILKQKFVFSVAPVNSTGDPCPLCGFDTITFHKDLGGVDFYDNYWIVCTNPYCDWPGAHLEQLERIDSDGPIAKWKTNTPRFQSVCISYNSLDEGFATKLFANLQQRGVKVWFAPNNMRGGKTIREQVQRAVKNQDRLLVVLSAASMASDWVHFEISEARKREKIEHRRILFPVGLAAFSEIETWVIEDDSSPDLAREVRKYFIPDFSLWRDELHFELAISRLLDALSPDNIKNDEQ